MGSPAVGSDAIEPRPNADRSHDAPRVNEAAAPSLGELIKFGTDVSRWHTVPHLFRQSLAEHSWGAAMLISRLYRGAPTKRLMLIEAALEHDLVEAKIGDMPRPGRTKDHRDLEDQVAREMGLRVSLPPELLPWLEWADLIEAGIYAKREVALGNQEFIVIRERISDHLKFHMEEVPVELLDHAVKEGITW